MVIKISNSTDMLKISSDDKLKYAKIDENGCSFLYKGKLDLIVNIEKLNNKILCHKEHCDVILMADDQVFFIELKNTENTIDEKKITEIINTMPAKFDGTLVAFNCIKELFEINSNKNRKIHYIFYIHKNTFDILKKLGILIKEQKRKLIGMAKKGLEVALIKTCGEDTYNSNDNTTIALINKKIK